MPMPQSPYIQSHPANLTYFKGVILVLMAGVFWSTMGLGIRSIETANVWQILLYRSCSLAGFLFILITYRSDFTPFKTIKRAGLASIIGGWGLVIAFSGGIYAIQTTTVANAMFLFASAPFLAAFLGWVILHESVRRSTWVATVIAILGIVVMVLDGISVGNLVGNVCALLSALVCYYADYSFVLSNRDLSISIGMGIFQVGAGLAIYTIGSKVVPAAELALLSMTEVLLGPLWVWIFIGEATSLYTLLGGSILLIAIAGNALTGLRRRPIPVI